MKSLVKSLSIKCKPVDVFHECPKCGTQELIAVDGDVLCSSCPWDSVLLYANILFEQKVGPFFKRPDAWNAEKPDFALGLTRPSVSVVA